MKSKSMRIALLGLTLTTLSLPVVAADLPTLRKNPLQCLQGVIGGTVGNDGKLHGGKNFATLSVADRKKIGACAAKFKRGS